MVLVLGFDGEFLGPCRKVHSLAMLGAAIFDVATGETLEKFRTHVRGPKGRANDGWDVDTRMTFWGNPKKVAPELYAEVRRAQRDAATPTYDVAGAAFCAWADAAVAKHGHRGTIHLLSDTCHDVSWLEEILPAPRAAKTLLYGRYMPIINSSFYYLGIALCLPTEALSDSEAIVLRALGYTEAPDLGIVHDHDPVNDALYMCAFYSFVVRHVEQHRAEAPPAKKIEA